MISLVKRLGTAVALVAILAIAGCSGSTAPASDTDPKPAPTTGGETKPQPPAEKTPVRGGTLIVGQGADALTLDPALTTDEASKPVQSLLFNSLIKFDANMNPVADLATDWMVSEDGTVYTFNLRKGVTFHSGNEMKASDVKFSIERMSDPELKSRWASYFTDVTQVEATDDYTVTVTLGKPNAAFISAIASYVSVLEEAFVKENPNLQRVANGTGPYKLAEWTPNTSIRVTRFADSFEADRTYVDEILFKIIPEESSRVAALRTGEVHFLEFLEPQVGLQLEQMDKAGQIKLNKVYANTYHMLGFNTKRPPFDNAKVREAIQYAVDREALLKSAAFGQGAVTGILTPALGDWALDTKEFPQYKRDVAKAKQLLKEAGYENGFEFSIMAPSNYPLDLNTAIALVEQLKEVGITAKVERTEWGTYVQNWVDRNFDTFTGNNGNWTDPDLAMYAALTTGGSTNAFQYSDPEIDDLLKRGRTAVGVSGRKQIYDEVQRKLVEKGPMVYTFVNYKYYAASPKLEGYQAQVTLPFKNLAYTWLTK